MPSCMGCWPEHIDTTTDPEVNHRKDFWIRAEEHRAVGVPNNGVPVQLRRAQVVHWIKAKIYHAVIGRHLEHVGQLVPVRLLLEFQVRVERGAFEGLKQIDCSG